MAAGEARELVRRAIDALPVRYRTVIVLHYVEEITVEEIGDVVDMPAGTAKRHLVRARRLLKDELLNCNF